MHHTLPLREAVRRREYHPHLLKGYHRKRARLAFEFKYCVRECELKALALDHFESFKASVIDTRCHFLSPSLSLLLSSFPLLRLSSPASVCAWVYGALAEARKKKQKKSNKPKSLMRTRGAPILKIFAKHKNL